MAWTGRLYSAFAGIWTGMLVGTMSLADSLVPGQTGQIRISGWGSSTMDYMAPEMTRVAARLGASYYNGGNAGVWSDATLAQQGAEPAQLTFPGNTVAAAGPDPLPVLVGNVRASKAIRPFSGTLAGTGIKGTLSPAALGWTFTRSDTGGAEAVPAGVEFLPDAGLENRRSVQILNIGKNDLVFGVTTPNSLDQVLSNTRAADAWNGTGGKMVLVIGHFMPGATPAISPVRERIVAVNAALRARYGTHYIDLNAYLTGKQLWADTGITPTPEDLAAQALGNKPDSVSKDKLHLNAAGNAAVAQHLIAPKLAELLTTPAAQLSPGAEKPQPAPLK